MKKNNPKFRQQENNKIQEKSLKTNKRKISLKIYLIIAFVVPVFLYLHTVNYKFIQFDDNLIITNNIKFISNLSNINKAFTTDAFINKTSSFYRPLQTVSYMIDAQFSGVKSTWMFHLSNILLLGFIACSLFLLIKQFSIPPKLAILSTLIFCLHPLFVSSVAWIPARGDLMLTLFSILSFLFIIEFLEKGKIIYLFLNWFSFTIALFCKETAAFLPFIFIIYYFAFPIKKSFNKTYVINIFLYAFSGILWLLLRSKAVGNLAYHDDVFGLDALISNLRIIPESLAKFVLPSDVAPIPGYSILNLIIGFGVLITIIILFIRNKERPIREKIFCISWFIILMFPPMLYKHHEIDYLDHRFFIPLIGILLFLLFSIPKSWFLNGDIKRIWIFIAVIIILSTVTFMKSESYSDPMSFYNTAVSQNPNSSLAYNNRGVLKNDKKDFQGAIDDYDNAIVIYKNYANAYYNRGNSKISINDFKGALNDYNQSILLHPKNSDALCNRANIKVQNSDYVGAISDYNKAIEINPKNMVAYFNRAISKCNLKDLSGAIEDCDMILKLDPNHKNALNYKAQLEQQLQMKK